MEEVEKWVCLVINGRYSKASSLKFVEKEIKGVFGKNFVESVVINDGLNMEGQEFYSFVKCRNYLKSIVKIKSSSVIVGVLSSYDNPTFVSEYEVSVFKKSVERRKNPAKLFEGDIVIVKSGDFCRLEGVVVGEVGKREYEVLFRLYTKTFTEKFKMDNVTYVGNIFDKIKLPVS
jgi:transcription antitermination factor NusG